MKGRMDIERFVSATALVGEEVGEGEMNDSDTSMRLVGRWNSQNGAQMIDDAPDRI